MNHDIYFDSTSDEPIIKLHAFYEDKQDYSRSNLIMTVTDREPYALMVYIMLDDPKKIRAVSARHGEDVLFDLTYAKYIALSNDVIFEYITRKYTLKYEKYDEYAEGHYIISFDRVYFTADTPLYITVKYLDAQGNEVTEEVKTKIEVRRESGPIFISV